MAGALPAQTCMENAKAMRWWSRVMGGMMGECFPAIPFYGGFGESLTDKGTRPVLVPRLRVLLSGGAL